MVVVFRSADPTARSVEGMTRSLCQRQIPIVEIVRLFDAFAFLYGCTNRHDGPQGFATLSMASADFEMG